MIEQEPKVANSKISMESQGKSNPMSLDRLSWTNRSSINQKCSLVEVTSNQGQRRSDLFERELDEKNHDHNNRNSNTPYKSAIGSICEQLAERKQTNAQQRTVFHSCLCYGDCELQKCPCFDAPDELCIKQHCCLNCIQMKVRVMQQNRNVCNCKNTKCLKSYCKCFQSNGFCGKLCKCEDCANMHNSEERSQALEELRSGKVQQSSCTCKKTKCNKKYCSCYAKGLKCGPSCTCEGCKNTDLDNINEMDLESSEFYDDNENNNIEMPAQMQFEPPQFNYPTFD